MGIALFTLTSLFTPLHGLLGWFMPGSQGGSSGGSRLSLQGRTARKAAHATRLPLRTGRPSRAPLDAVARTCAPRPLRVVRVVEAGRPVAGAGRMVISGRMADVCAELDRLVALEAQQNARH
jgi:hypothetical protein